MVVSAGVAAYLEDVLAPLGRIVLRRMFGGVGVYCGPVMFGLVIDDILYLRSDAETSAHFENEGLGPFEYARNGKPVRLAYWRVPERLLDEPEEMLQWARRALLIASRAAFQKAKTRPKSKRVE